jgi:hypothetical protein
VSGAHPIGRLDKKPFGYRASCGVNKCDWYSDKYDRESAERILQGHAEAVHPEPILVYRKSLAATAEGSEQ